MHLPELSKASPIPIMADESICDHNDAERLISLKACPLFNVKLGKSGGLLKAMKIAGMAAETGIGMQVGGFMESRLGMTAAAHLALSHSLFKYCDFDTPLMFTQDPVVGGIAYGANGLVTVPETPGLGAAIAPEFLQETVVLK
jgi:L-alanine-DL-glutamate epimerase-like enolase superfamily enzyme